MTAQAKSEKFAVVPLNVLKFLLACKCSKAEIAVVIAVLAHHSNHEPRPWPSVNTISQLTGLNRKRASEAVLSLHRDGVLTHGHRRPPNGRTGRSVNQYEVPDLFALAASRPDGVARTKKTRERDSLRFKKRAAAGEPSDATDAGAENEVHATEARETERESHGKAGTGSPSTGEAKVESFPSSVSPVTETSLAEESPAEMLARARALCRAALPKPPERVPGTGQALGKDSPEVQEFKKVLFNMQDPMRCCDVRSRVAAHLGQDSASIAAAVSIAGDALLDEGLRVTRILRGEKWFVPPALSKAFVSDAELDTYFVDRGWLEPFRSERAARAARQAYAAAAGATQASAWE